MLTPKHVAIIMDGNRRHARKQGLTGLANMHVAGYENCREIVRLLFRRGVQYVTVWASSYSNLVNRTAERPYLYGLLKRGLRDAQEESEPAHLYVRGYWDVFGSEDAELVALIKQAEEPIVIENPRHFTILFGHSGIYEVAHAASDAANACEWNITPEVLRAYSYNKHLPNTDLIIRTGVEQNLESGRLYTHNSDSFLPLHEENAVVYFTPTLWPDFAADDLNAAFQFYSECPRRKGT